MSTRLVLFVGCVMSLVLCYGCNKPNANSENISKEQTQEPLAAHKTSDVVKIVFVGQKDACECTRDRIAKTWKTLEGVLSQNKEIAVEKIQLDVEQEQADKLDQLRDLMVAPGIYYFDVNEHLVEMHQGEVNPEQIKKVL